MGLQAVYSIAGALCFAGEIGLLVVLIVRHQYKTFPIFTSYIAYNVLSDVLVIIAVAAFSMRVGRAFQFATIPLQYLLELGVLLEIAWQVLRPVRSSLPKGALRIFVLLVALSIVFGVGLAWRLRAGANQIEDIKRPLDLTVGLLRMLIFAVTAGFAQLLGIGWKDKVLQLASALSFYSAMGLMITLWERHQGGSLALDPMRTIVYLVELSFLVWAFTTKEVRRAEFSPQMEQFLVTLAGRAKLARTSLSARR